MTESPVNLACNLNIVTSYPQVPLGVVVESLSGSKFISVKAGEAISANDVLAVPATFIALKSTAALADNAVEIAVAGYDIADGSYGFAKLGGSAQKILAVMDSTDAVAATKALITDAFIEAAIVRILGVTELPSAVGTNGQILKLATDGDGVKLEWAADATSA